MRERSVRILLRMERVRLPYPCLVVLAGPSGAGKTTWADAHFEPGQVVSADRLRALVGEGEKDQRAGTDAFELLDLIIDKRLRRGLLTVVDTLGMDAKRRGAYREAAARHGVECHAVVFDTPAAECRRRNKSRDGVPPAVLSAQLARWPGVTAAIAEEPFTAVHGPADVMIVPRAFADTPRALTHHMEAPVPLRFGLQIPRFEPLGDAADLRVNLAAVAHAAEEAGFTSLWVMDHFVQIPQTGREWEQMLDSWTTLAFLAAHTERIRLGPLVTGVTYRNVAHLGKIAATLDVLSGGRVVCGLGAAWFEREHAAYGWPFPPLRERFARLEDALEVLPLLWGPGTPSFAGRDVAVAEAICYPRPLQERIPILVGGAGEKRTLRLVAQHADACNLFGGPDTVRPKVEVLHAHCSDVGRDRSQVLVTHLSTVLVGDDEADARARTAALKPSGMSLDAFAARVNAAAVDDHVGRFRQLADAGVQTAIVSLADVSPEAVKRFAAVISAFPPTESDW